MKHNVIPALEHLLVPIGNIKRLSNNPHKGDVDAMRASLRRLGQHRPVVARRIEGDTGIAVVGNHMHEAAEAEGWTHLAVAFVDEDEKMALARALMDNRVAELGEDDPAKLAELLPQVIDFSPEMFETVGWDDFEIASMETQVIYEQPTGYSPPQMTTPPSQATGPAKGADLDGRSDEDLIKTGAGNTDEKRDVVIQYTLVFSSSDQ